MSAIKSSADERTSGLPAYTKSQLCTIMFNFTLTVIRMNRHRIPQRNTIPGILILGMLLCSLSVHAEPAEVTEARNLVNRLRTRLEQFQKHDLNADAGITELELNVQLEDNLPGADQAGALLRSFGAMDRNRDGRVDFKEFLNNDAMLRRMFQLADRNANQAVSRDELYTWLQYFPDAPSREDINTHFSFADENQNGSISYTEFESMLMAR